MTETTTDDVRNALDHLDAETETSDLANGIRVTVSDTEIGHFWKAVRQNNFNVTASRLDDTLVAHVEAEESKSLGDLFG